jgi:hypothetical protein
MEIDGRGHGPVVEPGRGPELLRRQPGHQGRLQGAVHHQALITLLGDGVGAVVVDAVAVEGERREAEQQHRPGGPFLPPVGGLGRRRRQRRSGGGGAGGGGLAVDQVLALADRHTVRAIQFVAHGDEDQRAGAAGLLLHVVDGGELADVLAEAQRLDELHLAAGPHAARQGHRRQEAPAGRVAVGTGLRRRLGVPEVQPVEQHRHDVALGEVGRLFEGGEQGAGAGGLQPFAALFLTADPGLQIHAHTLCSLVTETSRPAPWPAGP